MKRQWKITEADPETVREFCQGLNLHRVTATVLFNRNVRNLTEAKRFLSPSLRELSPPHSMADIQKAAERIEKALLEKEKIMVFGDYDVDGITATCLLYTFLDKSGADVFYYIPHRMAEGYGLQTFHIENVAMKRNISLIITVDCGSTSLDAVTSANLSGIDVIVTDHHHIGENIPPAHSIINPKRSPDENNFTNLSGVGVAFFLLVHLRKHLRSKGFWNTHEEPNLKEHLDIVALGTIADIVPLTGENRILTKFGLKIMNTGARPGLKALIQAAGIASAEVSSEDIAFRLAPRLNAAGRIGHAEKALHLLLCQDFSEAMKIARSLNQINTQRQQIEESIFREIEEKISKSTPLNFQHSIIMYDGSWHEGVLGIVASRLSRLYDKPVILFSDKGHTLKGSARSVEGVNIYRTFEILKDDLENFGGHSLAAGLTIQKSKFLDFKSKVDNSIQKMRTEISSAKDIRIDCKLDLREISSKLLQELEQLQPYGHGTLPPFFMGKDIEVLSSFIVAKKHRKMILRQKGDSGEGVPAIQFNVPPEEASIQQFSRVAFRIQWNRYNGVRTPQVIIEESETLPSSTVSFF